MVKELIISKVDLDKNNFRKTHQEGVISMEYMNTGLEPGINSNQILFMLFKKR